MRADDRRFDRTGTPSSVAGQGPGDVYRPVPGRTWFAAKASITPELGGACELFWQPGTPGRHQSTIGCRITAIAPHRYLAFTWRGPDELSAIMNEGDPRPRLRLRTS